MERDQGRGQAAAHGARPSSPLAAATRRACGASLCFLLLSFPPAPLSLSLSLSLPSPPFFSPDVFDVGVVPSHARVKDTHPHARPRDAPLPQGGRVQGGRDAGRGGGKQGTV